MKKWFSLSFLVIVFYIFIIPTHADAFHYGDRVQSSPVSLDLIAQVQERDIIAKNEDLTPCCKFEGDAVSTRLLARLGLSPIPPIEIFGLAGGADLSIDEFDQYDSNMDFAFGGGVHLILYETPSPGASHLFIEYSYLQFEAEDRVQVEKSSVNTIQDDEIRWREHVVQIGGDSRLGSVRPYGGLRFSIVRGEETFTVVNGGGLADPTIGPSDIEEDDLFGVFGGIDFFLDPADRVAFNLEASLFDVNSFRAGLRFNF